MSRLPLASLGIVLALLGCSQTAPVSPTLSGQGFGLHVDQQVPGPAPAPSGIQALPHSGPLTPPRMVAHEVLVSVDSDADVGAFLDAVPAATVVDRLALRHPLLRVRLREGADPEATARSLSGLPRVRHAGLNAVRARSSVPDDAGPAGAWQWPHRPEHADSQGAWRLMQATGNPAESQGAIIVAIADTGVDVRHPEFAGRIESPFNATDAGTDPALASDVTDDDGHGTHVAGIVGAAGHNDRGISGVAPLVRLMPLKVFAGEYATDFDILRGLYHARDFVATDGAHVRVLNLSLGTAGEYLHDPEYDDAFTDLEAHGIVITVAAGNESTEVTAPGSSDGCLAVSSTSELLGVEVLSGFSNFGARIDLAGPGGMIWSTYPISGTQDPADPAFPYARLSGTSMAAPFVAGTAALVMARYGPRSDATTLTADFARKVKQRLKDSADWLDDPGVSKRYGAGRVNARRAITPPTLDAAQ